MTHHLGKEKRTLWSKFIRYWTNPLLYTLNLYEKGKPSLSRLMLLGGFIHGLATLTFVTVHELLPVPIGETRPEIRSVYLMFAALVYSIIFGYRGFHMWMGAKFTGDLGTTAIEEAKARPSEILAEAELVAKAAIGGIKAPTHSEGE